MAKLVKGEVRTSRDLEGIALGKVRAAIYRGSIVLE